jgi:hypothetical protein
MSSESAPAPSTAPAAPPAPAPGSIRYFVLLYTPAPHRAALQVLLAIVDELGVGLARELDHGVAHIRLQWWGDEMQRLARGEARHPWLLAAREPRTAWPDLQPLVQAAALDLAARRLAARQEQHLAVALFVAAAQLLGVPPPALAADTALTDDLHLLGRAVSTLAAASAGAAWAHGEAAGRMHELQERQRRAALPAAAHQATLAPLLVWTTLAAHHWQRAEHRHGAAHDTSRQPGPKSATMPPFQPGRLDGLMDNYVAWRAARRALRTRFRIPHA